MILATPRVTKLLSEEEVKYNTILAYVNSHNSELEEVGWQVTEHIFCIILPTQFLHSLKGEVLNKETI
jgi:predicted solute-binding protein